MAMAASSLSSYGGQNVMMMRGDMGSSNSLVTMLTSCNPHVNFPVTGSRGGGLEDAIVGVKRPYSSCYSTYDSTTLLDRSPDDDGGGDAGDDLSGGNPGGPAEKKRRLSFDQVRSLERNFETENKLEPERKMQLAKELGLQPRQVAVWFQNRRARWKTKQLERDYEMLNSGYLKLKADFESALREKDVLKAEVQRLSDKTSSQDSQQQSGDSSQCDSEAPSSSRKGSDPAPLDAGKEKVLLVDELVIDPQSSVSSGSHSSELLDAESPRTADSNPLLAQDQPHLAAGFCSQVSPTQTAADTFAVGPGDADVGVAVKLEEDHGFPPVDPSCGYFLPPLTDQSVLPWWDWA